jgi:hypothetical protein
MHGCSGVIYCFEKAKIAAPGIGNTVVDTGGYPSHHLPFPDGQKRLGIYTENSLSKRGLDLSSTGKEGAL